MEGKIGDGTLGRIYPGVLFYHLALRAAYFSVLGEPMGVPAGNRCAHRTIQCINTIATGTILLQLRHYKTFTTRANPTKYTFSHAVCLNRSIPYGHQVV